MTKIYAVGPFRLDMHDGVLFRGTEPVALGRRAVALLQALVERPGALVSKDTLVEAGRPLSVQSGDLRQDARERATRADRRPSRTRLGTGPFGSDLLRTDKLETKDVGIGQPPSVGDRCVPPCQCLVEIGQIDKDIPKNACGTAPR